MRRSLSLLALLAALAASPAIAADAPDLAKLEPAFQALETHEWGGDHTAIAPVRAAASAAGRSPALRAALEPRLIAAVKNAKNQAGRRWACEWLSLVATDASIDTFAALLSSDDAAHYAQTGLVRIASPKAAAALRAALVTAQGRNRLGVIVALGELRDPDAVAALSPLLKSQDDPLARAAALALGNIGSPAAAAALLDWAPTVPERLKPDAATACMTAADRLAKSDKTDAAAKLYALLQEPAQPDHVRTAALRGLMLARPAEAKAHLDAALAGTDAPRRAYMLRLAADLPGPDISATLIAALPNLAPAEKALALKALARRAEPAARGAVVGLATTGPTEVRTAALQALAAVGEAGDVPLLLAATQDKTPAIAGAARTALHALRGADVDAAIARAADGAEPIKIECLQALGARNATGAADAIVKELASGSDAVRVAAISALKTAGKPAHIPVLLASLKDAVTDAQREAAEASLARLCSVAGLPAADPLLAAMKDATPAARQAILRLLPSCPSPAALEAVTAATRDKTPETQDEAVRSLSRWPDAAALAPLRRIAAAPPLNHQVLAIRGIATLLEKADPARVDHATRLSILAEVWPAATRVEEKRLLLAALGSIPTRAAMERMLAAINDKDLAPEACGGAIRLGQKLLKTEPKLVQDAMNKVLQATKTRALRTAAERVLAGDDGEATEGDEIIN